MLRIRRAFVVGFAIVGAGAAWADISDVVLNVWTSNGSGTAVWQAPLSAGDSQGGTYTWDLAAPLALTDAGTSETVATLLDAHVTVVNNGFTRAVNVAFDVQSGDTDTEFIIDSPLLSFAPIPAQRAEGRASASVTVRDQAGGVAWLTGLGTPGNGAYHPQYNGMAPNGTGFTSNGLVASIFAGAGLASATQNDPPSGTRPFGTSVDSLSARSAFLLSAGDIAEFTTQFHAVPEPTALALLLLGAAACSRRR